MKNRYRLRILGFFVISTLIFGAAAADAPGTQSENCTPYWRFEENSAYNPCLFPHFFAADPPLLQTPTADRLNRSDLNVAYIQQQPRYDYDAPKNQHEPGDRVTFVATIANRGSQPAGNFAYTWRIDGVTVAEGNHPGLNPNETAQLTKTWVWQSGPHTIALELDPDNNVTEVSELNNEVIDQTNALAVGFWVEQSVYDWFNANQMYLGLGSVSWDDWAQRQLAHWNQLFANAIHPLTPNGMLDRVRLDKVVILDDGTWPDCSNTYLPEDRTVDLVWGFPSELVGVPSERICYGLYFYQTYPQFQNIELPLLHEMSHARYLIDLYGLDFTVNHEYLREPVSSTADILPLVHDLNNGTILELPAYLAIDGELAICQSRTESAFTNCTRGAEGTRPRSHAAGTWLFQANVRIQDGAGNLVQGSEALPVIGDWQHHLYFDRYHNVDLMAIGTVYGPYSAYAWNLIAGQRPVCGNYNPPCNIGEFLDDIPASNVLEIRDSGGMPVVGGRVEVYYARPLNGWYGRHFKGTPNLVSFTDASGRVNLGEFPFGPGSGPIIHTWGYSNALLLLRITAVDQEVYRFFEVTEANEAYWSGYEDEAIYPIVLDAGPNELFLSIVTNRTSSADLQTPLP